MAFPYLSENTFGDGSRGSFDAESDSASRLDFPHFSELARFTNNPMPYMGAYCMRVNLATSTTNAYVQETGSWDLSAAGSIFFRLFFWVSKDLTMANNDEFGILQLWSGASTVEGGAYINYTTANGLRLGIGETAATSFLPLTTGGWNCLELKFVIDSGGNDGTIDGWLNGSAFTQVTGLTQAVITSGVVGVLSQDAGTTAGVVCFDDIIADDARLGVVAERFSTQKVITQNGHVFVGPGSLDSAALLSTTAGNILQLYDTDTAYTTDAQAFVCELAIGSNVAVDGPITFKRGCYAVLTGTNPRGQVTLVARPAQRGGPLGPLYYSEAGMRNYGLNRVPRPQNV